MEDQLMQIASDEDTDLAVRNLSWFAALERRGQVYAGTVPHHVKARRRAAGKVAKAYRRANRGG